MGLFNPKIAPSHEALRAANVLGHQMARRDTGLMPLVDNAARFADFSQFRTAHRERLEQCDAFRVWQERLFNIAEREGRRFALRLDDSMTAWDTWYQQIVLPMKKQMWSAWEAWHDLPAKYEEAAARQRLVPRDSRPLQIESAVLQIAGTLGSNPKEMPLPRPVETPKVASPSPVSLASGQPMFGSVHGLDQDNRVTLEGPNWSF